MRTKLPQPYFLFPSVLREPQVSLHLSLIPTNTNQSQLILAAYHYTLNGSDKVCAIEYFPLCILNRVKMQQVTAHAIAQLIYPIYFDTQNIFPFVPVSHWRIHHQVAFPIIAPKLPCTVDCHNPVPSFPSFLNVQGCSRLYWLHPIVLLTFTPVSISLCRLYLHLYFRSSSVCRPCLTSYGFFFEKFQYESTISFSPLPI